MTPSSGGTTTIDRSELAALDTPQMAAKSRDVWNEIKAEIPPEQRETVAALLDSFATRLPDVPSHVSSGDYFVSG